MSEKLERPRHLALLRILQATSAKSARMFTYTVAVLGLAALIPGLQLPPELGVIAGGLGIEAMGILLDRVASGTLSDDEINQEVENAISESGISDLLTKDDFYQAFAHLRKGQRSLSRQNQAILKVLNQVSAESEDLQLKVVEKLEEVLMQSLEEPTGIIVAIGGGNTEYVLRLEQDTRLGSKNRVLTTNELVGGGCVNFTSRLLATGHEVYPVLSIGSDRAGRSIRRELIRVAQMARLPERLLDFLNTDDIFAPNLQTSTAVIVVDGTGRTIFSHVSRGDQQSIWDHLNKRLADIDAMLPVKPNVVRISHLHDHAGGYDTLAPGEHTKHIIKSYRNRSTIFANFGASQIQLGIDYWEEILQDVDILQLSLHEVRRLFAQGEDIPSLIEIVEWLRDRQITAVITLGKFGAVGTYKSGKEGVIFAWPLEIGEIIDSTGAGDAFSAGMASQLFATPNFTFHQFHAAIEKGRLWATFACTTLGGAGDCPDQERLEEFRSRIDITTHDSTEVTSRRNAEQPLRLIDRAFG